MSEHTSHEQQGDFTVTPRVLLMALLAIAIGLLSTVVAFVLLKLISLFTNLFLLPALEHRGRIARSEYSRRLRGAGPDRRGVDHRTDRALWLGAHPRS